MEIAIVIAVLFMLITAACNRRASRTKSLQIGLLEQIVAKHEQIQDDLETELRWIKKTRRWYVDVDSDGEYLCLINLAKGYTHIVLEYRDEKWWMDDDEMTDLFVAYTQIPGYGFLLDGLVHPENYKEQPKELDEDGDSAC